MKLLIKFLSSLLVASLCGVVVTTVFHQTVLNSKYMEKQFAQVNGYSRLTTAFCDQATTANEIQAAAPVCESLLGGSIKQKIDSAVTQLQQYYQGKASAPTLDLGSVLSQAQTAGIAVPNTSLAQPVQLAPQHASTQNAAIFNLVRNTTFITTAILVVALAAISIAYRQYKILPHVVLSTGFMIALLAAFFFLSADLLSHIVKGMTSSNAYISVGGDFIHNISRDLARRFGIIAGIILVIGLVTRIVAGRLQPQPVVVPRTASAGGPQPPLENQSPKGPIVL